MRTSVAVVVLVGVVSLVGCGGKGGRIGGQTRETRAILFVNSSNVSDGQTLGLPYNLIDSGASLLFDALRPHYGTSEMLYGDKATVDGFLAGLARMGSAPNVDAVDLMVNLHGGEDGNLAFADGVLKLSELSGKVGSVAEAGGKLRVVYNTACFAQTQLDAWLGSGFRAVNGAVGANANGFIEYPNFVSNWIAGIPFGDAVESAAQGQVTGVWDTIQRYFGATNTDSRKVIAGERGIGISGM